MEKKTSQKKINKSTSHTRVDDGVVHCILKEIGELKKELGTIKSKKNLSYSPNYPPKDSNH
jgi:hypothetical protein